MIEWNWTYNVWWLNWKLVDDMSAMLDEFMPGKEWEQHNTEQVAQGAD